MAIRFITVKCPECGADLSIEEGRQQAFCTYCGAKVLIQNENEFIYRSIDEAKIRQAETNRIVRMRELELEEKRVSQGKGLRNLLFFTWLVFSIAILSAGIFMMASEDNSGKGMMIIFYLGVPVVFGGAYLIFKYIPDKEADKILMNNGGIRIPQEIMPCSDKHYEFVLCSLQSAGFTNIVCINMHDMAGIGLLRKPGKVESVTVNGEKITSGGRVFMPDAAIRITYHGK